MEVKTAAEQLLGTIEADENWTWARRSPQALALQTSLTQTVAAIAACPFAQSFVAAGDSLKKSYLAADNGSWEKGISEWNGLAVSVQGVCDANARLWRMHKAQ